MSLPSRQQSPLGHHWRATHVAEGHSDCMRHVTQHYTEARHFVAGWTAQSPAVLLAQRERAMRLVVPELQRQLRASGGLCSSEHLLALMRERVSQPISHLARWIASRQVVQVSEMGTLWLPAFQFAPGFDGLREGVAEVLSELAPVLDDHEVALWFASPNMGLDGQCPADLMTVAPEEVQQVARLDRFIVAAP